MGCKCSICIDVPEVTQYPAGCYHIQLKHNVIPVDVTWICDLCRFCGTESRRGVEEEKQ
jgi:hypothetical protein